jgi:DNA-binding NarL/FixJ family response regulator
LDLGIPSVEGDPTRSHEHPPVDLRPLSMLLLEDDPEEKARVLSSIRTTLTEIRCVPTITAALQLLEEGCFDAIMIDRHLGGWVSAKTCRDLVARAGDIPVVGLINEDCVLGLEDGIEAGLRGVYYKDQIDVHLMRRLGRLSREPNVYRSPPATASARLSAARMPRARP